MKTLLQVILLFPGLVFLAPAGFGLDLPEADGSDGALSPPAGSGVVMIDLGAAAAAGWETRSSEAGKGVYDAGKWAVVFKYSSVDIPAGVTVRFRNHPSRGPVVWLVSGSVKIDGTIDLSGSPTPALGAGEPGPGGFRGGYRLAPQVRGIGYGPGGALTNPKYSEPGTGREGPVAYGSSQVIPLVGGSGGVGGGGGGAILIACRNTIAIGDQGRVLANGPTADAGSGLTSASGTGGAIRLVAERIEGGGELAAAVFDSRGQFQPISPGRIRVEAVNYAASLRAFPQFHPVALKTMPALWPEAAAATVRIVSVNGREVAADPRANLNNDGPDAAVASTGDVQIVLETANLEINAAVDVRIIPTGGTASVARAAFVSGDRVSARWLAQARVPLGYTALQARAEEP